jgi:hypothetical protein
MAWGSSCPIHWCSVCVYIPPAEMKYCFIAATDFWLGYFIFCSMVYYVLAKFKIYQCVFWCYLLQYWQFVRPEGKGFYKISTLGCGTFDLWLAQCVDFLGLYRWASWKQLFPHLYLLGLNSSPYGCNLWSQIFIPPSNRIYVRRNLCNFVLNFWWSFITHFVKYNSNTICILGGEGGLSLHLSAVFWWQDLKFRLMHAYSNFWLLLTTPCV